MIRTEEEIHATLVNLILDESGSMDKVRMKTISGLNEYIDTLKNFNGNVLFTLTKFHSDSLGESHIDVMYAAKEVKEISEITKEVYKPSGGTPLYDAVGFTIRKMLKVWKKKIPVLCVIMTDGEENSSKEFTFEEVTKLIGECEKKGWTFVYLGANQDAWAVGAQYGVASVNIRVFVPQQINQTYDQLGIQTITYLSNAQNYTSSHASVYTTSNFWNDSKTTAGNGLILPSIATTGHTKSKVTYTSKK